MTLPCAVLVLAAAMLLDAGAPGPVRLRAVTTTLGPATADPRIRPLWVAVGAVATGTLTWAVTGSVTGGILCAAAGGGIGTLLRRSAAVRHHDDDPADLAAAWTQLAVCLQVGLPVAAAVAAAAEPLDGRAGHALHRVAGLLELGADPGQAWHAAGHVPALAAFARAAGRSAATGAALAHAAHVEGARLQAVLVDTAEAQAQRAAVLITAPLGLCFLPAFVVLGIAPVVIGLADDALSWW